MVERRKGLWIHTPDPANGCTRLGAKSVTEDGGLDTGSPPAWLIPVDQPMATTPVVRPSLAVEASPGSSPS